MANEKYRKIIEGNEAYNITSDKVNFTFPVHFNQAGITSDTIKENKDNINILNTDLTGFKTYTYVSPAVKGTDTESTIPSEVTTSGKYIKFESLSLKEFNNTLPNYVFDVSDNIKICQDMTGRTQPDIQMLSTSQAFTLNQCGLSSDDTNNTYAYDRLVFANKTIERHCVEITKAKILEIYSSWDYESGQYRIRLPLNALAAAGIHVAVPAKLSDYKPLNLVAPDCRSRFTVETARLNSEKLGYIRISDTQRELSSKNQWRTFLNELSTAFSVIAKAEAVTVDSSYVDKILVLENYLPDEQDKVYGFVTSPAKPIGVIQVSYMNQMSLLYTKEQCDNKFATKSATGTKVTYIDEDSDDDHYPSAKCVYDNLPPVPMVEVLGQMGDSENLWNSDHPFLIRLRVTSGDIKPGDRVVISTFRTWIASTTDMSHHVHNRRKFRNLFSYTITQADIDSSYYQYQNKVLVLSVPFTQKTAEKLYRTYSVDVYRKMKYISIKRYCGNFAGWVSGNVAPIRFHINIDYISSTAPRAYINLTNY